MKTNILSIILCIFFTIQLSAQKDTIKILAIGNSFSEDAVENYLYDLAKNDDKEIIIGNLYIGGASIDLHVENSKENKHNYSYRKITTDGSKNTTEKTSLEQALKDEQWNYISLQQASPLSGKYNIIKKDLPNLIDYVNKLKTDKAKLIYHQTWAYQQDSKHNGFNNYNKSQQEMYTAIINSTKNIDKTKIFSFIIPSGTAIQNARTSSIGDNFTRDGYHLNLDYGRFTAACTWYEKLFNIDVRKNKFQPKNLTSLETKISKEAAHKAIKKPWKISKLNF